MEEDVSLNLELGGYVTKRKRGKIPEEELRAYQGSGGKKTERGKNREEPLFMHLTLPSLLSQENIKKTESIQDRFAQSIEQENTEVTPALSATSQHSMASSLQRQSSVGEKRRENQAKAADGEAATINRTVWNEEGNSHARKKLVLSKEQATLLEEHFREQATLNPKLKLDLAKQLSLQPRQVEVWFQNRRARTKLKQTEKDCKYLNDWYRMLSQENRRLKRELTELRTLNMAYMRHPFYKHLAPTSNLSLCHSCEHGNISLSGAITTPLLLSKPHFIQFIPERQSPSTSGIN